MSILLILFWLIMTVLWAVRIEDRTLTLNHPGFIALGAVISGVLLYFTMPALIPLEILVYLGLSLGMSAFASSFVHHNEKMGVIAGAALVVALVAVPLIASGAYIIGAKSLAEIPQVETTDDTTDLIDTDHISLTSTKTALWRADKVVGNLGYKVGVFKPDIQFIDGELTWLVPLDYNSVDKALIYAGEGTDGYIAVSAEEPKAEPKLVAGLPMRYTPNAILENNLIRHIWEDYPTYIIHEPVFQLDEQGDPKWVALLSQPGLYGLIGETPRGLAVTDPVTGKNEFYEIGKQPAWIQRVFDEALTETYLGWWGTYSDGWINSWWGQRDLKYPTGSVFIEHGEAGAILSAGEPDVYLVQGTDGNQYWFSAITTPGKDSSMVGYVLGDVQDGKFTFYNAPGYYNDFGAAANVQQHQKVAMATGLEVVQPIMYVIDDQEVWIIPVVSQTGEVMEIGLVEAHGGETYVGPTLDDVLTQWRGIGITADDDGVQESTTALQEIEEIRKHLDRLEAKLKAEAAQKNTA